MAACMQGELQMVQGFDALMAAKLDFLTQLSAEEKQEEEGILGDDDPPPKIAEEEGEVLTEEERAVGSVDARCDASYFSAGNGAAFLVAVVTLCAVTQASYNVADWWLSAWSVLDNQHHHITVQSLIHLMLAQ
jgi:hypothetical protein